MAGLVRINFRCPWIGFALVWRSSCPLKRTNQIAICMEWVSFVQVVLLYIFLRKFKKETKQNKNKNGWWWKCFSFAKEICIYNCTNIHLPLSAVAFMFTGKWCGVAISSLNWDTYDHAFFNALLVKEHCPVLIVLIQQQHGQHTRIFILQFLVSVLSPVKH